MFNSSSGDNRILDFEIGVDVIDLEGFSFANGNLTNNGSDSFFSSNASGFDFDLAIEGAIVTESDFI